MILNSKGLARATDPSTGGVQALESSCTADLMDHMSVDLQQINPFTKRLDPVVVPEQVQ
jgi:hypothetical protein